MKPPFLFVPHVVDGGSYTDLGGAIGAMLEHAREKIATTANTTLVETYWNTGHYIVEYEQHGADRAKYASALLTKQARDLTVAYGTGVNRNNLQYMRKLYRSFPNCTTLSCNLIWSHYLEILKCSIFAAVAMVTCGAWIESAGMVGGHSAGNYGIIT